MSAAPKNVLLMTAGAPHGSPFSTTEKRPPLGLGFLASVLRANGHTVHFIDNYLKPVDLSDGAYLRENSIDCVGMYISTICMRHALRTLHQLHALRLRGQWSGRLMVGGPHATVGLPTIPAFVDHVVQGEGEGVITGVVEGTITDRVVRGERIRDLDTLPPPAWDLFVGKDYNWSGEFFSRTPVFSMNTSRGCPFRCRFCAVNSIWGRNITMFSASRIVDDIQRLVDDYGCRGVYFREDNFTANKKRLYEFCDLIVRRGLDVEWACESKVSSLDPETMRRMAEAGLCGLFLGVESGSQRVLDYMLKDITLEQTHEAFRLAHKYDVRTAASIVVGVPTETEEELQATFDLVETIKPTVTWYNIFTGVPESELYHETLNNGLHEFVDDRGLVYLKGHNDRVARFYRGKWSAGIPVTDAPAISVILDDVPPNENGSLPYALFRQSITDFEVLTGAPVAEGPDRDMRLRHVPGSLDDRLAAAKGDFVFHLGSAAGPLPHAFEVLLEELAATPDADAATGATYATTDTGTVLLEPDTWDGSARDLLLTGTALVRKNALGLSDPSVVVSRMPVLDARAGEGR
jgi:radical SAM superfamily enzyme YgiQ (UPF0313 family)